MAFKPIFVGINKQLDPTIDELTGAVRDAKALNALFMDSVPELSAQLLINEHATKEAVSKVIFGTLTSATADDVLVISFTGHGLPDGGFALYDTMTDDLPGMTLGVRPSVNSLKHKSGEERLDAGLSSVAGLKVNHSVLSPRLRPGDLPGTCHHLANQGKLTWVK